MKGWILTAAMVLVGATAMAQTRPQAPSIPLDFQGSWGETCEQGDLSFFLLEATVRSDALTDDYVRGVQQLSKRRIRVEFYNQDLDSSWEGTFELAAKSRDRMAATLGSPQIQHFMRCR